MKALPLFFAASLVANAALVTVTLRQAASGRTDGGHPGPSSSIATTSQTSATTPKGNGMLPPELVAALNSQNVEALRDLLRDAGLSDDMVRALVQMQIWKKYETRFKALQPQPDPNKPWWKNDRDQQNGYFGSMTKAQREESRRLQREVRDETERLLGPDATQQRWQDPRLSFLPAEKVKALQQVQQDYQELISEVNQDSQGFRLASDAEKIRFLQEEQKRDIEALMTPEERQAYELRMSNTAQQLRNKMTQFDASEQEYLAIFPLQKAFDEKYNQASDGYSPQPERDQNYWKERREAEQRLQEQIKSVIGEQRYADSIRLQDNDYRQLEAATQRLQLPADTPTRLYSLRDTAAAAVQQIADNPNLATDQKKAALTALAASTRDQVRASLGNEGADAYFNNNGMRWIKELEKGNTITFNKDSSNWSTKALPKEPKKAVAK
ncbi:MAG: hypothetical protein K0R17_374 [Rariglobus sp.]|jgi:hypothetical protein|nr:hypothetical protein [Rariglobus sp.]